MRKKRRNLKVEERDRFALTFDRILSQKPLFRFEKKDSETGKKITIEKKSEYLTKTEIRKIRREIKNNWPGFQRGLLENAPLEIKAKILRLKKEEVLSKFNSRDWNKIGFIVSAYLKFKPDSSSSPEAAKKLEVTLKRRLKILRKKDKPA